jgi:hypothetical protein
LRKRRYEILLPHTHNDGKPVEPDKFLLTRDELIAEFGAVSLSPHAVTGTWIHGEARYEDQSMRMIVDVEDSAANRRLSFVSKRSCGSASSRLKSTWRRITSIFYRIASCLIAAPAR